MHEGEEKGELGMAFTLQYQTLQALCLRSWCVVILGDVITSVDTSTSYISESDIYYGKIFKKSTFYAKFKNLFIF